MRLGLGRGSEAFLGRGGGGAAPPVPAPVVRVEKGAAEVVDALVAGGRYEDAVDVVLQGWNDQVTAVAVRLGLERTRRLGLASVVVHVCLLCAHLSTRFSPSQISMVFVCGGPGIKLMNLCTFPPDSY